MPAGTPPTTPLNPETLTMKTSLLLLSALVTGAVTTLSPFKTEPASYPRSFLVPARAEAPAEAPTPTRTVALVVTDPQVDFLSPEGVSWPLVGESVEENGTVEHIGQLFEAAEEHGVQTFVSPHYYYPHDHEWHFEGTLEKVMHDIGMFDRAGPLDVEGFDGSGADWMPQYKAHIARSVVTSPHKIYGPETNDLVLQLRKRGIETVVLAGMSANLCTEAHMRELIEQGFEVYVVADATAAAKTDMGDGYEAAVINFRYISSGVLDTEQAVAFLAGDRS